MFSLRIVAGQEFSQSFDNDVRDAGEAEQEERIDKTLDNEEHRIFRITLIFCHFS